MIDEKHVSTLRNRCDRYDLDICLSVFFLKKNLRHYLFKVVLFADGLYLLEVLDILFDLLNVVFLLFPKYVRVL